MLDGQKKKILLIAVAIGLLLGGILVWNGGITLGTAPQLTPSLFIIGALVLLVTAGVLAQLLLEAFTFPTGAASVLKPPEPALESGGG